MKNRAKTANISADQYDNLQDIEGIGPKYEEALHAIGVRTFEDLAEFTPEALADQLVAQAGVKINPERIEGSDWMGQAAALTQQRTTQASEPEADNVPEKPLLRQQHAGFSLFFDYITDEEGESHWETRVMETRVYHDESGKEKVFPGIDPDLWVTWIMQQADLTLPAGTEESEQSAEQNVVAGEEVATAKRKYEAQIEINDVKIAEHSEGAHDETQVALSIIFSLTGPDAAELSRKRIPYRGEVRSMVNDKWHVFVESEQNQLEPDVLTYNKEFLFPMPDLGTYQLRSTISLPYPAKLKAIYEGPTLKIVP